MTPLLKNYERESAMTYKVKIMPLALSQLSETVKYISEILLVPDTAMKWLDTLQNAIAKLNSMPERHPLVEEEPWRSKGIRKFLVKGFFIYYLVMEEIKTVSVTSVVYGRQNQIAALKQLDN